MDENKPSHNKDLHLAQQALVDKKTAEHILRRVYPRIFQIACAASRNRRQAEDIAQVAAIEVLKSLNSYSGRGSIEAWVGQITHRVAMKTVEKERQTTQMLSALKDDSLPDTDDLEKTLSRRRLFETLLSKMKTIPKKRRISLLLHLVYGYTVNEVAELTEVSPNTVKDRLKTAYREMRTLMDEHPHLRAAMLEVIS